VLFEPEIVFELLRNTKLVKLLYLFELRDFLPFYVKLLQDDPGQSGSDRVVELFTYELHF